MSLLMTPKPQLWGKNILGPEIGSLNVTTEKIKQKVALREISRAKFERELNTLKRLEELGNAVKASAGGIGGTTMTEIEG